MIQRLLDLAKISNPAEAYALAAKWGIRLLIAVVCLGIAFVRGCSYGESHVGQKQLKAEKKEMVRQDKERRENTAIAVKTEKAEQQKAARLNQVGGRVHETVNSSPSCDISADELSDFNELAKEAGR